METELETALYSVSLREYPALPIAERIAAETRYAKALERRLGGPQGVADVLLAVLRLEETSDGADPSPAQLDTINQWAKAAAAARLAGFQGLAELDGAYFNVELD